MRKEEWPYSSIVGMVRKRGGFENLGVVEKIKAL
jgi:hypothetical protein